MLTRVTGSLTVCNGAVADVDRDILHYPVSPSVVIDPTGWRVGQKIMPGPVAAFRHAYRYGVRLPWASQMAFISSLVSTKVYVSSLRFLAARCSASSAIREKSGIAVSAIVVTVFLLSTLETDTVLGSGVLIRSSPSAPGCFPELAPGWSQHSRPPAAAGWSHP